MMQVRLRGERNKSRANATWTLIENDEGDDESASSSTHSDSSVTGSSSSLIQNHAFIKTKDIVMIKRGVQKCNAPRRIAPSSKYSYRLRRMLQTDLQMTFDIASSSQFTPVSPIQTKSSPAIAETMGSTRTNSCAIRKAISLHEEFSQDIENLLKSLQSTEFVGTIDPEYHSRYVSDESLARETHRPRKTCTTNEK